MASRVMLADNKPITDEQIQAHLDVCEFLWAQPKIDGMRVFIGDECLPQSRSGKEWKHKPLRAWCQDHPSLRGLDGEVVEGHSYSEDSFRKSMSGIRAEEGSREFTFFMFDYTWDEYGRLYSYGRRLRQVEIIHDIFGSSIEHELYHCKLVVTPTKQITTVDQVRLFEEQMIAEGWEGAMLRRPDLPYKFGRSTNRGEELIKLKRYQDAEAVVVGYEPWFQNNNEPEVSPLGYQVRSSHSDGKVALERLGALHVELATDRSVKFKIGVMQGVTHSDRDRLWLDRDSLIGRVCKFKHQGYGGGYDSPRQPVFLNWRLATEF